MSKKNKRTLADSFQEFDPAIEKLALERFLSGKQLFDYRTHRLRRDIRDEAQARAVLLRAQDLAAQGNKKLILHYYEKRLLQRTFEDQENP